MKTAWSSWHCVCMCVCLRKRDGWKKHENEEAETEHLVLLLSTHKCCYLHTSAVFVCCRHAHVYVCVCGVPWPVSIKSHDMAVFSVVLAGGEASTCFTVLVVYVLGVILGRLTGSNQLLSRSVIKRSSHISQREKIREGVVSSGVVTN